MGRARNDIKAIAMDGFETALGRARGSKRPDLFSSDEALSLAHHQALLLDVRNGKYDDVFNYIKENTTGGMTPVAVRLIEDISQHMIVGAGNTMKARREQTLLLAGLDNIADHSVYLDNENTMHVRIPDNGTNRTYKMLCKEMHSGDVSVSTNNEWLHLKDIRCKVCESALEKRVQDSEDTSMDHFRQRFVGSQVSADEVEAKAVKRLQEGLVKRIAFGGTPTITKLEALKKAESVYLIEVANAWHEYARSSPKHAFAVIAGYEGEEVERGVRKLVDENKVDDGKSYADLMDETFNASHLVQAFGYINASLQSGESRFNSEAAKTVRKAMTTNFDSLRFRYHDKGRDFAPSSRYSSSVRVPGNG